jgi:hypothetical protein
MEFGRLDKEAPEEASGNDAPMLAQDSRGGECPSRREEHVTFDRKTADCLKLSKEKTYPLIRWITLCATPAELTEALDYTRHNCCEAEQ